jgi:hypothetical protein
VNVLVDRHHAGLLYSLQLLFEDRFGYDLYIPVGHEWWDEGIWRFGHGYGDDRLARQFLNLSDAELVLGPDDAIPAREAEPHQTGLYYTLRDLAEYPERIIRCVTYEQFKNLGDWAYIVATVQDNQPGFDALAKTCGAKSVYQVGNTGQFVDWELDPLVLQSSNGPLHGRGVVYHQEYEKDTTFRYRPPDSVDLYKIGSFVNCFEKAHTGTYEFFQAAVIEMPDFKFAVHGSDGADGKVYPCSKLATAMATCGFAWHDKPSGDGFGHVIHYLASVGRPLIGHARYYNGQMAGPLWEDGYTCIDADKHDTQEMVRTLRSIVDNPDRHTRMCQAIRERVDELVDFDAEAARIAEFLGVSQFRPSSPSL